MESDRLWRKVMQFGKMVQASRAPPLPMVMTFVESVVLLQNSQKNGKLRGTHVKVASYAKDKIARTRQTYL